MAGGFAVWEMVPHEVAVSGADVLLATVKSGDYVVRIRAPGKLRPRIQQWVTSRVAGTVLKVSAHPGTAVVAGAGLLTMVNPTLETSVLEAEARLASTRARAATEAARLKGQLLTLEGHLGSATARERALAMKVDAERKLYGEHVIGRLQYETDRLNANNAKMQEALIRERIAAFREDLAAETDAQKAAVEAARATVQEARRDVRSLVVRAPISGVVQVLKAHSGQAIGVGDSVARIARTGDLEAVLDVGPGSAGELADGQAVKILMNSVDRSVVRGRVVRISPNVVRGVVPVTVRLRGVLPASVRPNLAVSGIVTVARIPHAVYVERPIGAQPQTRGRIFLVDVRDGRAVRRTVRFGVASTDFIQILSGLTPGQRVVVSETRHWHRRMRIR